VNKEKFKFLTFHMKLGAGFVGVIFVSAVVIAMNVYSFIHTRKMSRSIMADYAQDLVVIEQIVSAEEMSVASARAFLITRDPAFLARMEIARKRFSKNLSILENSDNSALHRNLFEKVKQADSSYYATLEKFIAALKNGSSMASLISRFENELQPKRESLETAVDNFIDYTKDRLDNEKMVLSTSNRESLHLLVEVSIIAFVFAVMLAIFVVRAISQSYRKAEQIAQIRQDIVETVAHDLKNPLTAIKLTTDLMLRAIGTTEVTSSAKVQSGLYRIKKALDRMSALIFGLLDLAKLESKTFVLEKNAVIPNKILADVFDLFEPLITEKKISLELDANAMEEVACDYERIVQVLSNLLSNALKFSSSGTKISLSVNATGNAVIFSVADNGLGISANDQTHIFDRFWQASEGRKGGTGLGLAICKGIVEAHGGKIWVESKPGVGSTFKFSIPNTLRV
jgi:signal transduction histidine kinase